MLEAEVLQVHAPPFVSKETNSNQSIGPAFSRVQRRRSFIKKVRKVFNLSFLAQVTVFYPLRDKIPIFKKDYYYYLFYFIFSQKRRDRAAEGVSNGETTNRTEVSPATEDISVPKDLDLIALPQLCFPGTT